MSKIGRNDPCICGNGLKYKKCCINKNLKSNFKELKNGTNFHKFLSQNDSIHLLKIFSLLQLIPENQSKEFRLEEIQKTICSNLNSIKSKVNYHELEKVIEDEFSYDQREDPCEASFTENIMFFNGNNIVFPGMTNNSTGINQNILHSILFYENDLLQKTKEKIKDGTFFILHLFNDIALELGYSRYMFKDVDYRGRILFPDSQFLKDKINLVQFSLDDINNIYRKYGIQSDVIQHFVSSITDVKISTEHENTLTLKPFIKIEDIYYLVMPSCQMWSLNHFILNIVKESKELKKLNRVYNEVVKNEVSKYLNSHWSSIKITTPINEKELILKIDTNKYAYVQLLYQDSKEHESRANKVIKEIKSELQDPTIEFMSLHLSVPISMEPYTIAIGEIQEAKYQLTMNYLDLERLITYWDLNKLSLWKYAKARERADSHDIFMVPSFSILTYYKWYKRNMESFFPTDEKKPDYLSFDFAMQGEVVVETNKKNDKHFIFNYGEKNILGYLPVIKTEEYAPIYTSEEILNGVLRMCIEKYSFPIWISLSNNNHKFGKNFTDAILYWLNELFEPLNNYLIPLGELPVEIVLNFDESFVNLTPDKIETLKASKIIVNYRIKPYVRKIYLDIPTNIFNALNRKDNHGERILMSCVLKAFSNLLQLIDYKNLNENKIETLINLKMPLGIAKMILTIQTHTALSDARHIPKIRFIQDADVAIILEENVSWLGDQIKIPKKINDEKEKITLCTKLINSLISQLRVKLKNYNSEQLLKFLMLKNESLIQSGSYSNIQIPSRLECFSKYVDVIEEYQSFEVKRVKSSLAIRCLIEFVLAEPYYGEKVENDDDVDFLIAIMHEIINYGFIKDSIQFNIDNPEMGLLDSGRIGIDHSFHDTVLSQYRAATTSDEVSNYKESFDENFDKNIKTISKSSIKNEETYYDKVDFAFKTDWGITLPRISYTLLSLIELCFDNQSSYYSCSEREFIEILENSVGLTKLEINALFEQMVLTTRGKMDEPINKEDYPEIFPWRYNRKLSYMRRPILRLKRVDGSFYLIWSARQLEVSSNNLIAIFLNGTLKVGNEYKNINNLLSKRNNIKGKEFRNTVYTWLKENTNLSVVPYEVKISESGVLKANKNYGDVDILAFEHESKIIYSIECKNTKQAKIMYDFHNNIRNYISKQLPNHVKRDKWLKENTNLINEKFDISSSNYVVKSIVISSYQVPVKFTNDITIPIYSFNEIKEQNIL